MSSDTETNQADVAARRYQQERIAHWDRVAQRLDEWNAAGASYQKQLAYHYKLLISPGLRVLEVGCGQGDLLAALKPSVGVGVDFSGETIERASKRHPFLLALSMFCIIRGMELRRPWYYSLLVCVWAEHRWYVRQSS